MLRYTGQRADQQRIEIRVRRDTVEAILTGSGRGTCVMDRDDLHTWLRNPVTALQIDHLTWIGSPARQYWITVQGTVWCWPLSARHASWLLEHV